VKTLVTGGGGFLGRAIVEELLDRGDTVSVLSRSRYPDVEALGATGVAMDLSKPCPDLIAVLSDVDTVFHVAAKAGIWGDRDSYWSINVGGTKRLLEASIQAGVTRFVYTSSPSAVFSGQDEIGLTESDCQYPERYLTHYPESKAAAEQIVLAANGRDLATTVLRPHLIWGPRDPHLVPRLLARGRAGRLRIVGSGTNRVGLTYVDNAAHAHVLAADVLCPTSANAGKAYFITDDDPVVLWEWVNRLFVALSVPPVTRRVSAKMALNAGGMLEWIWRVFRLGGEPPMTRFMARQLATHHYYDLSAARADFGYSERVGPSVGWDRMIEWFVDKE